MRKALYYIFLVSALIAFIAATYIDIFISKMFYDLGDHHAALETWEAFMYWAWLAIALLLWLKKELAIIPLVWQTSAFWLYSYQVFISNARIDGYFIWQFNQTAAITNIIMLVAGYLYYLVLIFDNRSKILAWLTDRFGPVK